MNEEVTMKFDVWFSLLDLWSRLHIVLLLVWKTVNTVFFNSSIAFFVNFGSDSETTCGDVYTLFVLINTSLCLTILYFSHTSAYFQYVAHNSYRNRWSWSKLEYFLYRQISGLYISRQKRPFWLWSSPWLWEPLASCQHWIWGASASSLRSLRRRWHWTGAASL